PQPAVVTAVGPGAVGRGRAPAQPRGLTGGRSLGAMSPIAIELTRALPEDGGGPAVGAIGVGVFADPLAGGEAPEGVDAAFPAAQGFTAKAGEACVVPGAGGRLDVALGLGPAAEVTTATYRKAAARLARAAARSPHLAIDLLGAVPEHLNR